MTSRREEKETEPSKLLADVYIGDLKIGTVVVEADFHEWRGWYGYNPSGDTMADKAEDAKRIQSDPGKVDPRTTGPNKSVPVEFVMPKADKPEPEENEYAPSPPTDILVAGQAHDRDSVPPGPTPASVYAPPMPLKKDLEKKEEK